MADDLMTVIGSFTDLRAEIAPVFGQPLAEEMLPRRAMRPRKGAGLSRAACALHLATPGFLRLLGDGNDPQANGAETKRLPDADAQDKLG